MMKLPQLKKIRENACVLFLMPNGQSIEVQYRLVFPKKAPFASTGVQAMEFLAFSVYII